jgi:hypothetical protein
LFDVFRPEDRQTNTIGFSLQVIGNRLAQVHFYKKEDAHGSAETMETLVHKSSGPERTLSASASSHVQYSSMSNANVPSPPPAPIPPTAQVIIPQMAAISKAATPIRDSAQFVSDS